MVMVFIFYIVSIDIFMREKKEKFENMGEAVRLKRLWLPPQLVMIMAIVDILCCLTTDSVSVMFIKTCKLLKDKWI